MLPIPLHVRSRRSLGLGTAAVPDLARRASLLGLPALALTDLETLGGQIHFHDACAEAGVRPLTGMELRPGHGRRSLGRPAGRLVLLARDATGYRNLCRIASLRGTRGPGEPDDPVASLAGRSEGLYVLTDDVTVVERVLGTGAAPAEALRLLLDRPGSDDAEHRLSAAGRRHGVPLVAGVGVGILDPADRELQTLRVALHEGTTVEDARTRIASHAPGGPLDAPALRRFRDRPEAVRASHELADTCRLDLGRTRPVRPHLPGTVAGDAAGDLRARARSALQRGRSEGRYRGDAYDRRLERELDDIVRLGHAELFLAVAEIVRGAASLDVPTAVRGSAAASLVAHLIGASEVDPVRDDLLFERFLHARRPAPPDVDLDVASTGRSELRAWVARRFGRERVAGVATVAAYRARGAIRAGLTAFGAPTSEIRAALARLPPDADHDPDPSGVVRAALQAAASPTVRAAAPAIARLVGLPSHRAAHPGGLVLGDGPLADRVPLERAPGGAVVTQYDLTSVERAGLSKIDLLGNHFLSELRATRAHRSLPLRLPTDDADAWDVVRRADTIGLFQIETPPVRQVLRRLGVDSREALVAALAVVRPGAAAGAAKERFVRRARGEEPWEPLEVLGVVEPGPRFRALAERLTRTYGVLLYDEDIVRLLASVGGTSPSQADALRSAVVAADDDPETLRRLRDRFVAGAEASGVPAPVARRAWRATTRFASYSFAEAHAAAYADLAWRAVWLRTHEPAAFGAALIDHHRALYPLRTVAAAVQRWGVRLLPPDVDRSGLASTPEQGDPAAVRIGMRALKGLRRRSADAIVAGAPWSDLGRLLDEVRPTKAELRALVLSGSCDRLPPLSPGGYPFVHEAVVQGVEGDTSPDALRAVLERVASLPDHGVDGQRVARYRTLVRVRNELAFLDMHPSEHPVRLLRERADRLGCLPTSLLAARRGRRVRVACLLAAMRTVAARKGRVRFLTVEDEHGLFDAVLQPAAEARLGAGLTTPGPYLMEGVVGDADGDPRLVVQEAGPFGPTG